MLTRTKQTNGTSRKGCVITTFNKLVAAFGNPCINEGPSEWEKVTIEWCLCFPDGTIATIYDWKCYGWQPLGDKEYEWNIGGHSSSAVGLVHERLVQAAWAVLNEPRIEFSGPFFDLAK
jgi:hypothetical protein